MCLVPCSYSSLAPGWPHGQQDRIYRRLAVDERIFRPQDALTPTHEKFDWKAVEESPVLDDEGEIRRQRMEFDGKQP